jgi:hypothetical protein
MGGPRPQSLEAAVKIAHAEVVPIYEYRCECGALLEAIEKVGAVRDACGELCTKKDPPLGQGRVERVMSSPMIRGDGREAKEATFDPAKRSNRPGGADNCGDDH